MSFNLKFTKFANQSGEYKRPTGIKFCHVEINGVMFLTLHSHNILSFSLFTEPTFSFLLLMRPFQKYIFTNITASEQISPN